MYHDVYNSWEDGEEAEIEFIHWVDSINFCLIIAPNGRTYKLSKDEEKPDAGANS